MALTAAEVAQVSAELRALVGGRIQKIHQPTPTAVTFEIRIPGRTLLLLISVDPDAARLHLLRHPWPNPPSPPPFCQWLRAHLQGAQIVAIEPVPGERIVRLRLVTEERPCSLLVQLTGRTASLLVLDREDRILAESTAGRRRTGDRYELPPPRVTPRVESHPATPPPEHVSGAFPLSSWLEARYGRREQDLARDRLRQARLSQLRRSIKKAMRRVDALRDDLEKATRYREYGRYGELLKANLGLLVKGQDAVTVTDYFDPAMPELTLPLDPAKSPQANMAEYFRKQHKFQTAEREIRPRILEAERDLATLTEERRAVEEGVWQPPESPSSGKRAAPRTGQDRPPTTRRPARSGPFRRFTSADGLPIYVGKNARENEELTFRFAHSEDVWLHARGMPGSHVIIRLEKGMTPPPETLKDAATLAVLYSDLKKNAKGEVIYTRRKWVRKAKGQPPGTVTVTREKTLFVALDRVRLDRLKQSS